MVKHTYSTISLAPNGHPNFRSVDEALNAKAEDGWDLAQMLYDPNGHPFLIFKKPVKQPLPKNPGTMVVPTRY